MTLYSDLNYFYPMKKPVIIFAALIIVIAGCKVDTSGLPGAGSASSSAALLLGKWYVKSVVTVGTAFGLAISNIEADFTNQDYYIFNKDQTLNISEVTAGNGVGVGSYSYTASSQQLVMTDPTGSSETANVLKLTADSLVYSYNLSVPALGTQTLITTHLAHQ